MKNIFLKNNDRDLRVEDIINKLLYDRRREQVVDVLPLPEGFNSQVYKASTDKGTEYFIKKYIVYNGDTGIHISTEFNAFSFLWKNGIRNIPEPICVNNDYNIGIYTFISGYKIKGEEISKGDLLQATGFLKKLHDLKNVKGSDKLPVAAEACFTLQSYIDCIDRRLSKLKSIPINLEISEELNLYLENSFSPFYEEIKHFIEIKVKEKFMDRNLKLSRNCKTLSPSDFGFHNAIKQEDKNFIFFDFEFFGWDDPAKLISDFYLHPRMSLPYSHREFFFEQLYSYLNKDINLVKRLPLVYLLLSLKWSLIMLNIFHRLNNETINLCSAQLQKAKDKLNETMKDFDSKIFPITLCY